MAKSKKGHVIGLSAITLQSGTERTYFVSWTNVKGNKATLNNTDKFEVQWSYKTQTNKPWFNESVSTVSTVKKSGSYTSTYNAPNNASRIRVRVRPVAKTHKVDKKTQPYYTGAFSGWKSRNVLTSTQPVIGVIDFVDAATITTVGGNASSLKASWTWPDILPGSTLQYSLANHVAGYEYEWEYSVDETAADRDWLSGTSGEVTGKAVLYSVPSDATFIRFRFKPIAESNATGNPYWETNWGGWEIKKVSSFQPNIPEKDAITGVTIGLQRGTSDTLFASWDWDIDNTDHYEFEWQYYAGDVVNKSGVWYEGTTGTSELTNTTYQIPANAKKVRFRVKAVAETYKSGSTDIDYWVSKYPVSETGKEEWTTITISSLTPETQKLDAIKKINIDLQSQSSTTLRAVWIWNQSGTKEYQWRWQYSMGTGSTSTWYVGTSGTSTAGVKNATYSIPSGAKRVRFKVKAVSKTQTIGGNEYDLWTSPESSWEILTLSSLAPQVTKLTKKVTGLNIDLQDGTANTVYTRWTWSESNTASFDVQWSYYTSDGIWFDQETDSVDATSQKISLYQVPQNALRVRVRIQPISRTRTVAGEEYPYWTAPRSSWESVAMRKFEPAVPAVQPILSITIGQQAGTTDTLYATWTWTRENTDHYEYEWQYKTANNIWFEGSSGSTSSGSIKNCTYQLPANAVAARVCVLAVAKTYTHTNTKEYEYWTTEYSAYSTFLASQLAPKVPSVPTVSMDGLNLTAELDVYDSTAKYIEFQIVANDTKLYNTGKANIVTNHASYTVAVAAGNDYKVRARGCTEKAVSDWSEYSSKVGTVPKTIGALTYKKALSPTSIRIGWAEVPNAEEYNIEYAIDPDYFDASSEVKSVTVVSPYAILTGLDTGVTWYIRARASNSNGQSGWSKVVSLTIGKTPSPPTTWSETTTAIVGSNVILYWVHNSEDDSRQTEAVLELTILGQTTTVTLDMSSDEDVAVDQISSYTFETTGYPEGAKLTWRVKTRGIMDEFSDWSVERFVDIYALPSLTMGITDPNGSVFDILTALPMAVSLEAGPLSQNVIGYTISIVASDSYESLDVFGNNIYILQGTTIYSKYFGSDSENPNELEVDITAGDVNLENGVMYNVICIAAFDSGLTAEATQDILIAWEEDEELYDLDPDAEIMIDEENMCCYIRPFCYDENEEPVPNVTLAVYRRDFDGKLTEIGKDIPNDMTVTIMDPHPALDYARYRIIASSNATGRTFYYDVPALEIGIKSIVIQWGEGVVINEDDDEYFMSPPVSGTILKLPYNISVQDSYAQDVNLVKYIGREYPVSYYGTQLGSTSEWSTDVPKFDTETLYALRCLAVYRGDVYVREPSGSGYWAQVNVSFDRSHDSTVVPVSLSITRVEGGA